MTPPLRRRAKDVEEAIERAEGATLSDQSCTEDFDIQALVSEVRRLSAALEAAVIEAVLEEQKDMSIRLDRVGWDRSLEDVRNGLAKRIGENMARKALASLAAPSPAQEGGK